MAKVIHNKLVRDKIPEIIEAEGKTASTRILSKEEYLEELIKKLGEEYDEFKEARNVEELADLQEVILALADALNISYEQLAKTVSMKALNRGAFKKRIFLESVE
jgi:predicted house-cleaning noncanonical NTP pyrophosphatase (MazG superfamily)